MIGPSDVRRWAESVYPKFLQSLISGEPFFPLRRDRLGRVAARADVTAFLDEAAPLWAASKDVVGHGYKVILEQRNRHSRGVQNEPIAVEIQNREDLLSMLGKRDEVAAFEADVRVILDEFPAMKPALMKSPTTVVENHDAWRGILEVVRYLNAHPRPGCFVRALPVSVHTKFIEAHTAAIEMLLAAQPQSGYDPSGENFAQRCGFTADESSVRGRFLCPELMSECGFPIADVELRVGVWIWMKVPGDTRVVICENKANFLALPPMPRTLALWGQGGAASGHLPRFSWLKCVRAVYWGDIDPCGFGILAKVREAFPSIRSVLMDAPTLDANTERLSPAKLYPGHLNLDVLTDGERAAVERLIVPPRGIEQEKLLFETGIAAVRDALLTGEQSIECVPKIEDLATSKYNQPL